MIGNKQLKVIAHEPITSPKANLTVTWAHRESARARLRALVKRIRRPYGYPPDLKEAAVQRVPAQSETLLAGITAEAEVYCSPCWPSTLRCNGAARLHVPEKRKTKAHAWVSLAPSGLQSPEISSSGEYLLF